MALLSARVITVLDDRDLAERILGQELRGARASQVDLHELEWKAEQRQEQLYAVGMTGEGVAIQANRGAAFSHRECPRATPCVRARLRRIPAVDNGPL